MRRGAVARLAAMGCLSVLSVGALCAIGSGPAAQTAVKTAAPAPVPDVVVDDWRAGPLGQQGIPPGWEGQTWGKTSAFALSVVVDESGQRVLHL